jgi:hypothetical protein
MKRSKIVLVEDVDYVVIEDENNPLPRIKTSVKIKAFLLGFFWCFIPFGIIASL